MFTGLVETVGRCAGLVPRAAGAASLTIEHGDWDEALSTGDSVAVQGACLTVASVQTGRFTCDVLQETLEKTNLGQKRTGDALNLERALRWGDRMGGHLVSGHIDGLGELSCVTRKGEDRVLCIRANPDICSGIILKGSVTLDGVSLTITAVDVQTFSVHIIPHTWAHTSLCERAVGDSLNIETDMIGKYVAHHIGAMSSARGVTMNLLRDAGIVE
jgi:riboflavin synthase